MASLGETINVKGIALKSGISRNNIVYTAEEMAKTAIELANKPILMDHESKSTGVIGRTTKAVFNPIDEAVYYEGWVKETGFGIVDAIKDGRLDSVSIGAMCEELLQDEENGGCQMMARGIHYMELSTTPTPGVPGVSLTMNSNKMMFKENIEMFKKESATDTSKPLYSDSKTGTLPEENKLRLACPYEDCEFVSDNVPDFEAHMMSVHNWTDLQVDEYLRKAGLVLSLEDQLEGHEKRGVGPAMDVTTKSEEQPAKDVMSKGPYESVLLTEKEKTEVQSLIFSKDKFDVKSAKKWAKDHNFVAGDTDETDDSVRLRQKQPGQYKRFRTIELDDGVKAVIGVKDKKEEIKMADIEEKKLKAQVPVQPEPKPEPPKEEPEEEKEEDEEEEDEAEENPVAYKPDSSADKKYDDKGFVPKPGKFHRVAPFDKVSAKTENAKDLLIESLAKQLDSFKTELSEMKKAQETKVVEKGLVVKETYAAGDKTYEVSDLRFESLGHGRFSFWKMPTGPKGQFIKK